MEIFLGSGCLGVGCFLTSICRVPFSYLDSILEKSVFSGMRSATLKQIKPLLSDGAISYQVIPTLDGYALILTDADADDVTVNFEADVLLLGAGHVGLEVYPSLFSYR